MINLDNSHKVLSQPDNSVDPTITSNVQLEYILALLDSCLKNDIEGDIVEFGCYVGESAKKITRMLNLHNSTKQLYVYDSFEGLPKPKEYEFWREGVLKTDETILINNFINNNLSLPHIYKGWFRDVPEDKIPSKICFAFLDGDLYESIYDSLTKIYHKLSYGAVVCFHDYERGDCPGVKKAVDDFLNGIGKTERIQYKICDQLGIYTFLIGI